MAFKKWFKIWVELSKIRITFVVTLTMMTGYLLHSEKMEWGIVLPTIGIFLMACGSAAMNQCQEKTIDAAMERTKVRPLPAGRVLSKIAWMMAIVTAATGFAMLWLSSGRNSALLGLLALVWYNGVYTYLKRVTAFAVVPGSFIGAIPPAAGYVAAGGNLSDPRILVVATFFFIWQIPHFWLLLFRFGKQYELAGLPSLSSRFTTPQLSRLTCIWMMTAAITALLIPMVGQMQGELSSWMIVATAIWMSGTGLMVWTKQSPLAFRRAFMHINFVAVAIMAILVFDALHYSGHAFIGEKKVTQVVALALDKE